MNAPRGTQLYQRLKKEGRLLGSSSGDNTDFSLNFIPKMNHETLINGYKKILDTIYSPKHYYKRVRTFLKQYRPKKFDKKTYFKSPLKYCLIQEFIFSLNVLPSRITLDLNSRHSLSSTSMFIRFVSIGLSISSNVCGVKYLFHLFYVLFFRLDPPKD